MEDISGLFALRSNDAISGHDILVISFPTETRIMRFDSEGGIEELAELGGFDVNNHTLLAINLPNNLILQGIHPTKK